MKVLVAEDNASNRLLLSSLLTVWGYEAVTVKDGWEAWERITAADPPMLLILDWMMPGIQGIELCRLTRETPTAIKPYIIFLTCRTQIEDIVAALQGGADDYITKPFDIEELRARLQAGQRILELQADLKRERDRAQLYLDQAGVLLMGLNTAGLIQMINRKGSEILGYSPAELIGLNWFLTFLHPEERNAARRLYREAISSGASMREPVVQTVVTRREGERILELRFSIIGARGGDPDEILVSGTDVTEKEKAGAALRRSEESYRGLFDNIVINSTVLSAYAPLKKR